MRKTTLIIAGFLSLAAATAHARDYKAGSLDIADPWSRATPKGAIIAAGYMKITNTGTAHPIASSAGPRMRHPGSKFTR